MVSLDLTSLAVGIVRLTLGAFSMPLSSTKLKNARWAAVSSPVSILLRLWPASYITRPRVGSSNARPYRAAAEIDENPA